MSLRIETAALSDDRWLSFVARSQPTLFQTPDWCQLVTAEYGFAPRVALALRGVEVAAGLPFADVNDFRGARRVAFAFSDFCEPLGDPLAWPDLESALCADGIPWQIRGRVLPSERAASTEAPGVVQSIVLPKTVAEAHAGFHQKQRVNAQRMIRAGAVCKKLSDASFIEPFFLLVSRLRKQKFRILPQPRSFFERLVEHYFPARGFGLLAELEGKVVAAMMLLAEGETLYVKYSASDPDLLDLRPNNYLFSEAIEEGIRCGYRILDLGISNEEGLQRFKRHLGAHSTPYHVARYLQTPKAPATVQMEAAISALTRVLTEPDVPLSAAIQGGAELYRFFV